MTDNCANGSGYRLSTTIVAALSSHHDIGQPVEFQPHLATQYYLADREEDSNAFVYSRSGSPDIAALETLLSQLDNSALSVVTCSGMSAITTVFRALLSPGDTLIVPADCYYATRKYAHEYLARMGVKVIEVPTAHYEVFLSNFSGCPRLIMLETPANPSLDVVDIASIAQWCKEHATLLAVDNTTATPLGQSPLALGADIVIMSGTKNMCGHSDMTFGYSGFIDPVLAKKVNQERIESGAILGQFHAWLAMRSLATFPLRFRQQNHSAQKLAEFFFSHPAVGTVRYPGLPTDPSYPIARAQMRYYGSLIGIEFHDQKMAKKFLSSAMIAHATSFGGIHTSADDRIRWGDKVSENFIRLSVGLEDTDDLIAECERLLA